MINHIKAIIRIRKGVPLSPEERSLYQVAYKNIVGAQRASYRKIKAVLSKEEQRYCKYMNLV